MVHILARQIPGDQRIALEVGLPTYLSRHQLLQEFTFTQIRHLHPQGFMFTRIRHLLPLKNMFIQTQHRHQEVSPQNKYV